MLGFNDMSTLVGKEIVEEMKERAGMKEEQE